MLLSNKKITFFLFLILYALQSQGQDIRLTYFYSDTKKTEKKFGSVGLMMNFLKKEQKQKIAEGYLESSIDTNSVKKNEYTAVLQKGPLYKTGTILVKHKEQTDAMRSGKFIYPDFFKRYSDQVIAELENSGYPFAYTYFDSLTIDKGKVNGTLLIEKGPYYKIDSLTIKGDAKIDPQYIYRYLGIQPGDDYNEKLVRTIDQRIKEIPFLQTIKPTEILFTQTQCIIYVYLKKRNASSFNGILGVLPDSRTGKTTITGDARIILKNAFTKAETFDLNWRKIANKTQDLKVNLTVPFWFKTPIGTEAGLKMYKRDSSFLELNKLIGLTWQINQNSIFKVFYNRYDSDILSKSFYTSGSSTLQNSDIAVDNYGIGLKYEKLDYRLNPRKGVFVNSEFSAGSKKIKPNAVNDESVYANEITKSENYTGNVLIETYLPVAKLFAFKFGAQSRFLINQKIYRNELLRLGGIKNLRGFDEETILASAYAIGTAEFRLLFEENSALFVFYDQGWYENNSTLAYSNDRPSGFGAGINFQVKAGIFSFTWALGNQLGNPVLLKNSKLHFGFINYF